MRNLTNSEESDINFEINHRQLVETINSIIIGINEKGIITFFNRFSEHLFGYTREEVIGENLVGKILPEKDTEGNDNSRLIENIIRNPNHYYINESRGITKNGEGVWFTWSVSVNKDGPSKLLIDGNDTTRVHEQKERADLAYRIINNSPDMIARLNAQKHYVFINKSIEEKSGRSQEDFIGKQIGDIDLPVESAKQIRFHLDKVLQTRQTATFESSYENRYFLITISPEINETVDYLDLFSRDISELKKVEKDLERSNKELEQFAYSVSHDLQEPLRSIIGFLQLLQIRYSDQLDEKGRKYIERTVAAGCRMQTLINDLLSLSRMFTGREVVTPTNLNRLLERVLGNLHSTIQEHNATIDCADLPVLSVDPSQIQSLFQNLIANAIKYNKSFVPRIEIDYQPHDDGYEFIVKDNGIGIPPKFHERIFQVFQRLHTTEEYEGTGIGLAKCKKIVENHDGRIWVESQPGEGSTFHFTLPRCTNN
jgi:PAS domain S-box-containing protein